MKSRYLVLAAILSTGSLPLLAQDGMPGGNGVAIKAHATNTADKAFIRKATEGSMTEVEFGKIAVAKSNNPEVKNFGQKMICGGRSRSWDRTTPCCRQVRDLQLERVPCRRRFASPD